MTSTEETQALLPVTQADRDAAWPHRPDCYRHLDQQETWQNWNAGIYDHIPLLQTFARYRISHSLPGDAHPDLEGHIADAVRDACNIVLGKVVSFDDSRGIAATIADRIKIANAEYAAALTPSALSGDAGEGKRDRLVALWHDTEVGNVITLPALLGMTDEQYSAWVRDPSALSGDAGEAMSKRTLVLCVSGKGPTPHLEVHFANLADAHAAHNQLLGIKEEADDAR